MRPAGVIVWVLTVCWTETLARWMSSSGVAVQLGPWCHWSLLRCLQRSHSVDVRDGAPDSAAAAAAAAV